MKYSRKTMTRELAESLIEQYGGQSAAARAIVEDSVDSSGRPMTLQAVRMMLQESISGLNARSNARHRILESPDGDEVLNQIANVLKEAGVDPYNIGEIKNVKLRSGYHEVVTKDKDGNPVLTRTSNKNTAILLHPTWEHGPKWQLIQPGKPVAYKETPRKPTKKKCRTIAIISDTQIGFLRHAKTNELSPIHDLKAIEVALQIIADVQPDQLGYVGDFLDLPEMSRWLQNIEFTQTTQPSLDEGHRLLCQFEAAMGSRDQREPTMFVSGNHDRRLAEYCLKNSRAAFGLRPADRTPEDWPALSIPFLLGFEKLGIQYVGEYPAAEWWITDDLVVRHNPEGINAYAGSVIAGHTHHIRRTTVSSRERTGPVHRTCWEIGCLTSLEKHADHTSLLGTQVPSNRGFVKNWAQGFALVHLDGDDYYVEQVEILRTPSGGRKAIRPNGSIYEVL